MRIAAIADFHCRVNPTESYRDLLNGVQNQADVLLIAGDLTDTGLPKEAEILVEELEDLSLPIIAVLGNHDHESDKADELVKILTESGIHVLNGTVMEIDGVGFVGTKGFCGGFGDRLVQPFGERVLKTFIRTSIEEVMNLENALVKLDCQYRVAVLHYAPIPETLNGEPPEIYPFLGTSRLGNALDRQGVNLVVHGHAHHGASFGRTPGNIPVYNVSRFVQSKVNGKPYSIFDLSAEGINTLIP